MSTSRLRHQIRVLLDDEIAFGPGKAQLLEAIGRHGSISAAARDMGMSYTRAWALVDAMNRSFREPLVLTATGGKRGGAQVSDAGRQVLVAYRDIENAARDAANAAFARLQPMLRDDSADSGEASGR